MTGINTRKLGADGEEKAVQYLLEKNYAILKTNYRVGRLGEIDIIARDAEYICFIEVKTRRTGTCGSPGEAVTAAKQRKIHRIAAIYLSNTGSTCACVRFDVIEIILTKDVNFNCVIKSINHIKNAF